MAIFAGITFVSEISNIYTSINETFGEYFGMLLFGIIVVLIMLVILASVAFMTKYGLSNT